MSQNQKELVERFVEGDEAAFAELVQIHRDALLAYAHAIAGRVDLAEDAVQEAFIEAYARRHQLEKPEAFAAWVRAIVRSRLSRMRRGPQFEPLPGEVASSAVGADAELDRMRERQLVASAIAGLPEHERVAVHLFYVAGSNQQEIAALLDVPVNTVKSRLHSARARLGEELVPLLGQAAPRLRPRASPELVTRIRFFRALDARDYSTLELLLEVHPGLVRERRRREDERVPGIRWGMTALHLVARAGDAIGAELLLGHGAALEAGNDGPDAPSGATPLYTAAAYGQIDLVRLLLAHGASAVGPTAETSPLRAAIVHGNSVDAARLLIDAGAEVTMFEAVALNDRPRVETLLAEDPAAVNARITGDARGDNPVAHTPLHIAARRDVSAMIELLLDRGADLDARDALGRTAVEEALCWGSAGAFRALVARGAAPSAEIVALVGNVERAQRMVALIDRVVADDERGVQELLERDPSLSRARLPTFWPDNYVGGTALHCAACFDRRHIVDLLVEYGAEMDARDRRYGGTPRAWALEFQRDEGAAHLDELAERAVSDDQ
jgi:RNA polymerase sigma factor (sigma-70 family)